MFKSPVLCNNPVRFSCKLFQVIQKGVIPLQARHEWKHEINLADMLILRQRLRAVASPDPHARDGKYLVRSLYFDSFDDRALREKLEGAAHKEKFRIRYYNGDTSAIYLEKKTKSGALCRKEKTKLTCREAQAIVQGSRGWMLRTDDALLQEFYAKLCCGLEPKTIVDYTREPFVYPPGNVRVTLDCQIRTGLRSTDFLNPQCPTIPAGNAPAVLEVKWDAFLPSIIRDAVQLEGRRTSSFSKYAACRIYG